MLKLRTRLCRAESCLLKDESSSEAAEVPGGEAVSSDAVSLGKRVREETLDSCRSGGGPSRHSLEGGRRARERGCCALPFVASSAEAEAALEGCLARGVLIGPGSTLGIGSAGCLLELDISKGNPAVLMGNVGTSGGHLKRYFLPGLVSKHTTSVGKRPVHDNRAVSR